MLRKIRIENNSGIMDEVTLNLEKGKYEFKQENIFQSEVVNPAVIYGRNSSGKTSILRSFSNLINIFSGDLTDNNLIYGMKNIFGDLEETKFNLTIELKNKIYNYMITIKENNVITAETVEIDKKKYLTRNDYQELDNNSLSVIRYLGREKKDQFITELYIYLQSICFVSTEKEVMGAENFTFNRLLVKNSNRMIKIAENFDEIMNLNFQIEKTVHGEELIAIHEDQKMNYKKMISSGTRDFYEMIALMLEMENNSLLIIDEIEKTFHPNLLSKLIALIVKENKIQIISSSHNTNFMKNLRPDQIFFTKRINKQVMLEKLAEKYPGIREIHNIEKLYMGGKFE